MLFHALEEEKMASKTVIKSRLEFRRKALEQAQAAYLALLSGQVKSYAVGSRNLTRLDLPQLEETIAKLEKEMREASKRLEFEYAAVLRDRIIELRGHG